MEEVKFYKIWFEDRINPEFNGWLDETYVSYNDAMNRAYPLLVRQKVEIVCFTETNRLIPFVDRQRMLNDYYQMSKDNSLRKDLFDKLFGGK
jgi:hypothetical protein